MFLKSNSNYCTLHLTATKKVRLVNSYFFFVYVVNHLMYWSVSKQYIAQTNQNGFNKLDCFFPPTNPFLECRKKLISLSQ